MAARRSSRPSRPGIAALLPIAVIPLYAALQYATFDPAIVVGVALVDLLALVVGHGHDPGVVAPDESSRPED